ncbi:hypothetical protein KR018_001447 [Drosophila ironensis]|nr:hypothetical protein KR018_001447 [Drosophila ironensis]
MCSASVGSEGSVTLQLRDAASASAATAAAPATAPATATAATSIATSTSASATNGAAALATSTANASASTLENALTIGYPDPEMLADVLGTIQTASLKNNNCSSGSTISAATSSNSSNKSSGNNQLSNPNKITITRRSVQSVSTSTNTGNSGSSSNSSSGSGSSNNSNSSKTNTSYIKNCLIRSSSCSNTVTNVTTLAQIMSNSSTSSAASLLNQHNNNSNCSNSSNFSTASSVGSSISIGSSNSSNSNDSNSSSGGTHSLSFKGTGRHVPGSGGGVSSSSGGGSCNTSASIGGIGIISVEAPRKNRPKLSSPTRHGPQQCQICCKIFGNASALAKHKLTHSDERKYICALCSKAFKRQDHLNGHMMTHRNKKPYECKADGCGKSYCDARSLRRHSENHHAGGATTPTTSQSLSPTASSGSGASSGSSSSSGTNGSIVATSTLSLSPATASGDASSPDGATCIRTYISTGNTVVDAATGIALSDEQIKAMNLPIKTGVSLLSPTTSTSSNASSTASSSASSAVPATATASVGTSPSSVSSQGSVIATTSSPTITLSEGVSLEGEGLTREQLDLISKIMQQTKQTSAQVTVSSPTSVSSYKINTNATPAPARPRTWNMQLLNNSQNVTVTVEDNTDMVTPSSSSPVDVKEEELNQQIVAAINPHLLNIVKLDKPVECNLCHRKFKNIPALNGHMRLHGGYYKKDPETRRSEKRESSGPPLQTASIGVRALIEEKIISKRKDISKGAFVVPAPPHSSGVTTPLRRSISDLENFLSPKSTASGHTQTLATSTGTTTAVLPAATTIKSSNGLSIQQIGLPQSIEIFSGGQKQSKTLNLGSGTNTITITTNNVPTTTTMSALTALKAGGTIGGISAATNTDPKDSTLIELLKRGTRIAVTSKKSQSQSQAGSSVLMTTTGTSTSSLGSVTELTTLGGSSLQTVGRQIITNNNRTVIIPSDVQVVSTKSKLSTLNSLVKSSSSGTSTSSSSSNTTTTCSSGSISLADGTPLSLTIAPNQEMTSGGVSGTSGGVITSGGGGVYTVTYTSDGTDLFDDTEVYNVSDTEMLLQTVDSMELLNDDEDETQIKSEHSEDFALLSDAGDSVHTQLVKLDADANGSGVGATGNSNATTPTTPLPTFQQFHSKELIMQNSSQIQAIASMRTSSGVLASPLHSPLAYPTPPSSHENMAQSSPFIEDAAAQFVDASNTFFGDKTDFSHIYFKTDDGHATIEQLDDQDNEKILKLKSVLEESSFDPSIKVEDLLNGTDDDTECDLREFAETNLSFLDEDQEFLNDSRNATSPLSESFFTSGIGSAEDVKQVLREVLPDENMQMPLSSEQQGENIIDLYYLPGLGLQSQMMPNSEDPLLSSSPREFGQQRQQGGLQQQQQQQQQIQQQPCLEQQIQTSNNMYQQQQQQLPQEQQQIAQQESSQQQQQQQMLLSHQQLNQSESMPTVNNQQPADYMLPMVGGHGFNPVASQTQFMDNSQGTGMVGMQPLNSLLQPLLYGGGGVGVNSTGNNGNMTAGSDTLLTGDCHINPNQNQTMPLDGSLMFACGSAGTTVGTKPLLPSLAAPIVASVANLQPLSNQTNSILKRRLRSNAPQETHKFSKFHTLSPHRSKLRKPSRTHYTPGPILNPDRKGTGLYCNVRKQLGQGLFDAFDDDFGDPVGLVDFSDESKVNLGSTYQAQIPSCRPLEDAARDPAGAELMWNPEVQEDEKILMRYIDLSKSSAVPMGSHSEEVALQTLLKAGGNSAAAVLSLLQTQSGAFQMKWTAHELEQFLRGLERHGKDFGKIASELLTKTSGDCVQMYYFWKKLCVDYKVSHLKMEPVPVSTPPVERPYVCEIPDCSASFSSKAALHGHVRIHAYGRSASSNNNNSSSNTSSSNNSSSSNNGSNTNSSQHAAANSASSATGNSTNNSGYACAQLATNSNGSNANNNASSAAGAAAATHPTGHSNNCNIKSNGNATPATSSPISGASKMESGLGNGNSNVNSGSNSNSNIPNAKEGEFPCKVCGK